MLNFNRDRGDKTESFMLNYVFYSNSLPSLSTIVIMVLLNGITI